MTHSYLDWQINTLMLAYDAVEPLGRDDEDKLKDRQQHCEREVHAIAQIAIPQSYRDDPEQDFPPAVVMELTRATVRRAAQILNV